MSQRCRAWSKARGFYFMQNNNSVAGWIKYARNNLESAIREMEAQCNPRLRAYEIVLFNCHQSVEKTLKAYLLCHKSSYPLVHDLQQLRMMCAQVDPGFAYKRIVSHCAYLNMFWNVKYPDFTVSVDASHASRAINSAKRVYDFVSEKLGLGKQYFVE